MKRLSIILVILVMAGCTPKLSAIRSSYPEAIIHSDRSPKLSANCIYRQCQTENDKLNSYWNRVDMTELEDSYYLSLFLTGGLFITQVIPVAEITVKPEQNGSVIELRSHDAPNRTGPRRILEYINACITQNSPGK